MSYTSITEVKSNYPLLLNKTNKTTKTITENHHDDIYHIHYEGVIMQGTCVMLSQVLRKNKLRGMYFPMHDK